MFKTAFLLFLAIVLASCSTTYYVVRHAEKESAPSNMTSDVPLSAAGAERAEALREILRDRKIVRIYSTGYQRTKQTAQPLATATGLPVQQYDPRDTAFIPSIKNLKGNTLIVGHSNTVDDIINALMGEKQMSDLPDTQYGDLFILTRKGGKWTLEKSRFGN